MELTHASFFSGVGGLDRGLEQAGWRTVSFSEIDPYASAVLAERWPGVPNLGDIVRLAAGTLRDGDADGSGAEPLPDEAAGAVLWTGGFPCQDLSLAGKRRGMGTEDDRTRSGLAYAFLDLVERHRPPAILLENVPGLLSSNGGKDFGALLSRLGQLGYWWAYRILDAQFFGVPQRRRRVFVVALHAGAGFGADSPAAVLSVGARCDGHLAESDETRTGVAERPVPGVDIARAVTGTSGKRHDDDTDTLVAHTTGMGWWNEGPGTLRADAGGMEQSSHLILRSSPHSGGVREADGLAGRLDDRQLSPTLRVGPARPQDGGPGDTVPIIAATLNSGGNDGGFRTEPGAHLVALDPTTQRDATGLEPNPDSLLPLGLDSHRYRCCGNGVVSDVSEWVGVRLAGMVAA